jgi:hypothetical protein
MKKKTLISFLQQRFSHRVMYLYEQNMEGYKYVYLCEFYL